MESTTHSRKISVISHVLKYFTEESFLVGKCKIRVLRTEARKGGGVWEERELESEGPKAVRRKELFLKRSINLTRWIEAPGDLANL
jgi:hypothetical protein